MWTYLLFCFELILLKGIIIDFSFLTLFLSLFFFICYKNSLSASKSISLPRDWSILQHFSAIVCGSEPLVQADCAVLWCSFCHRSFSSSGLCIRNFPQCLWLVCCLYATLHSVIMIFVGSAQARLIVQRTVEMLLVVIS